jgi:hypothetical protein
LKVESAAKAEWKDFGRWLLAVGWLAKTKYQCSMFNVQGCE